jgi:hypothetical protein
MRVIDAPQRENQGFADRPRGVDRPSATLKLAADPQKNYAIFNVLERLSFATGTHTLHLNQQLVNNNESQIRRYPFLSCQGDRQNQRNRVFAVVVGCNLDIAPFSIRLL